MSYATGTLSSPDSVTYIGHSSFANNQLNSVTIPNRVTRIGHNAFYENQLTGVTIGSGVTLGVDWDSPTFVEKSFDGDLDGVYNNGGKQAGKYTTSNAGWDSNWRRN